MKIRVCEKNVVEIRVVVFKQRKLSFKQCYQTNPNYFTFLVQQKMQSIIMDFLVYDSQSKWASKCFVKPFFFFFFFEKLVKLYPNKNQLILLH